MEETSSPSRRPIAPPFQSPLHSGISGIFVLRVGGKAGGLWYLSLPQTSNFIWPADWLSGKICCISFCLIVPDRVLVGGEQPCAEMLGAPRPDRPSICWPMLECTRRDNSLTAGCKHPSQRRRGAYGCTDLPGERWTCQWASFQAETDWVFQRRGIWFWCHIWQRSKTPPPRN